MRKIKVLRGSEGYFVICGQAMNLMAAADLPTTTASI
jgi:hypothetical protein